MPSEEALSGIAIQAGEPIIAYHYQMVPVDHPERDCYLTPLNGHYGSRSEGAEAWLERELAKRAQGPIVDAWNGPVAFADRESARPTREKCAAAYNPAAAMSALEKLEKWLAGDLVPGLVEAADGQRTIHVAQGCSLTMTILRQVALARIALGEASAEIIPFYRAPAYTGEFPLVDPPRDWYAIERP